jgi:glycosyltransferase involved in cell wall biosynthesis
MAARVCILLPTYDEEKGIGGVIDEINRINEEGWEIVIVDGGSTDRTLEIAKKKGAKVLAFGQRGKGRAIAYAFKQLNYDCLVLMDADLTYPPSAIPAILDRLRECDVVVASRFRGSMEDGAMKGLNRTGNVLLTMMANALYGQNLSDACSGMRGFTRKAYKGMKIDAPHFEVEANFLVEEYRNGLRVCEIPVDYKRREGTSKLSPLHGLKIGSYLLKKRLLK